MDFSKLDDKRVLITGAADGIGLALARRLRAGGAQVFLSDVSSERLARSARELGLPSRVCDVRDAGAVEALVDAAWRELGAIDLLCANAGVVTQGSVLDASREELDWIFGVNVWGIVHACRPFVARLRAEHRRGHILMTGSETSLSYPGFIRELPIHAYLMTKHCVLALADSLRGELAADGIGVSVLCPGSTATGLAQNSAELLPARPRAGARAESALPAIDAEVARGMASLNRTPDQVAEKAIEGLRKGLFVIPTHAHIRADAEARWREIERSFAALGLA